MEMGFAVTLNKIIYALEEDKTEICRDILFKEIIKTSKELVKRLK